MTALQHGVVVDASLVLKWVLNEPHSAAALHLLETWVEQEVMVAALSLAYCTGTKRIGVTRSFRSPNLIISPRPMMRSI